MTEENVTKAILGYLIKYGWRIVSFDFPQSGTGRALHPAGSLSKNMGVLIPDIIAAKEGVGIYMENKDHYYPEDFRKVHNVLDGQVYATSFLKVLGVDQTNLIGGIGLPEVCCNAIEPDMLRLVDFVFKVNEAGSVSVYYTSPGLDVCFFTDCNQSADTEP